MTRSKRQISGVVLCAFLLSSCAQSTGTVTQAAPSTQAAPPSASKKNTNRVVGAALIGIGLGALLLVVLITTSLDGAFDET